MPRPILLLGVLGLLHACSNRALTGADGGLGSDGITPHDGPHVADHEIPPSCTELSFVGQVQLEVSDTLKMSPRIAFDGERFAVLWHSQPMYVSSMTGELRFALVDRTSQTQTPDGISLAENDGSLRAALLATPKAYAVAHRLPNGGVAVLRAVDAKGQTIASLSLDTNHLQISSAALAAHPSGVAVLTAGPGGSPELLVVDLSGTSLSAGYLHTAELVSSVWLAPRPAGGFAAAYYTANSRGQLFALDPQMIEIGSTRVGQGLVSSPSFAVLPDGFAVAYGTDAQQVEVELYDATAQSVGRQVIGHAEMDPPVTDQLAAAWSGDRLFVAYSVIEHDGYILRSVDSTGTLNDTTTRLSRCQANSRSISMAWGQDRLAIATVDEAGDVATSTICVTLMGCP